MIYSTIMVTGCGGDIGIGIGKILRMAGIASRIIGCDVHSYHPGTTIFDQCYVISRADSPNYLTSLVELLEKQKVDLVIPASEVELRILLDMDILCQRKDFITANMSAMGIGFDKYKTAQFLRSAGLPQPWTVHVKDDPIELPCIIKSRDGCGSRDVAKVDAGIINYFKNTRPNDIWQEYLQPDEEEYTCGLYRTHRNEVRTLVMRRKLQGGLTGSGEVVHNEMIEDLLVKLARAIELSGSINVQLRLTDQGPKIFEINPRFSSTIVFRHLMGFQDVIWSIMEHAGVGLDPYVRPKAGTRFYRTSQEVIINSEGEL